METNYYDFMRVSDLKKILNDLPDDMLVVIPVVDEDDVNYISGFRKIRTAGILACDREEDGEVFCINGCAQNMNINNQIAYSGLDVNVSKVLYSYFVSEDDWRIPRK